MASTISTTSRAPELGFGTWLSQGALAGIFVGFLLPAVQMLAVRNPYNFLFIPVLPLFLFFGLLVGSFKSLIFWACTTILPRRLAVLSRVAITVLLLGSLMGVWWWQWFSASPMRSVNYSTLSSSNVASLEGIRVLKLSILLSADPKDLTEAQFRNLITYKLMDAGIEVVDLNSRTAAEATLYVEYSISRDSQQREFYNSNYHFRLTQDVVLHRDPNIRTEAPTWECQSASLTSGLPQNDQINEALDQFVHDYNRANSGAAAAEASSIESAKLFQLIWNSAYLIVTAVVFSMVIGSNLRPWPTLIYGVGGRDNGSTMMAVVTGILLRMLVVFLSMESILMLICILHENFLQRDLYFALLAVGHCTLAAIISFGRFKFVTLATLTLIIISSLMLVFKFSDRMHWIVFSIILGYLALWIAFLLTRSSLAHSAFSNFKQELRYYLID